MSEQPDGAPHAEVLRASGVAGHAFAGTMSPVGLYLPQDREKPYDQDNTYGTFKMELEVATWILDLAAADGV